MTKYNTNIYLVTSKTSIRTPTIIKIDDKDEYNVKVEIILTYDGKKYIGKGKDDLLTDAFADLQYKLPKDIRIKCCMTCKYGNMCPFGNSPRELFCTEGFEINNKLDLAELFDYNKYTFYRDNLVLCDYSCNNYEPQTLDYFTYNDYLLKLNLKKKSK